MVISGGVSGLLASAADMPSLIAQYIDKLNIKKVGRPKKKKTKVVYKSSSEDSDSEDLDFKPSGYNYTSSEENITGKYRKGKRGRPRKERDNQTLEKRDKISRKCKEKGSVPMLAECEIKLERIDDTDYTGTTRIGPLKETQSNSEASKGRIKIERDNSDQSGENMDDYVGFMAARGYMEAKSKDTVKIEGDRLLDGNIGNDSGGTYDCTVGMESNDLSKSRTNSTEHKENGKSVTEPPRGESIQNNSDDDTDDYTAGLGLNDLIQTIRTDTNEDKGDSNDIVTPTGGEDIGTDSDGTDVYTGDLEEEEELQTIIAEGGEKEENDKNHVRNNVNDKEGNSEIVDVIEDYSIVENIEDDDEEEKSGNTETVEEYSRVKNNEGKRNELNFSGDTGTAIDSFNNKGSSKIVEKSLSIQGRAYKNTKDDNYIVGMGKDTEREANGDAKNSEKVNEKLDAKVGGRDRERTSVIEELLTAEYIDAKGNRMIKMQNADADKVIRKVNVIPSVTKCDNTTHTVVIGGNTGKALGKCEVARNTENVEKDVTHVTEQGVDSEREGFAEEESSTVGYIKELMSIKHTNLARVATYSIHSADSDTTLSDDGEKTSLMSIGSEKDGSSAPAGVTQSSQSAAGHQSSQGEPSGFHRFQPLNTKGFKFT